MEIKYKPIGLVRNKHPEPSGMPVQPGRGMNISGEIEIFPEYADGLKDLDGFSHIYLITHLHRSKPARLKLIPFLDSTLRGVFATRAPSRPNSIGLSVVRIKMIKENIIYADELDLIDNTPVLDIKPYIPGFDNRENVRTGWLDKNIRKMTGTRDDGRFTN